MGPEDWAHMASDIEKAYYNYEGFVVIWGQTLWHMLPQHYLLCWKILKTGDFTGLNSFAEIYNDFRRNLIISLFFIN